jgi:hypothetical protein
MKQRDYRLVLAAILCGPHPTLRAAVLALCNHPSPKIARLANGCTQRALENRLRPYSVLMKRGLPGQEFLDDQARAVLRFVSLALPYLPGAEDDPDLHAAMDELLWAVNVHGLAPKIVHRPT